MRHLPTVAKALLATIICSLFAACEAPTPPARARRAHLAPSFSATDPNFVRIAAVGANGGTRGANDVMARGDVRGSIVRMDVATFNAMTVDELRAAYDVLIITFQSGPLLNVEWATRLRPFLERGGGVIFEDYSNLGDFGGLVTSAGFISCQGPVTYAPVVGLTDGLRAIPSLACTRYVLGAYDATLFRPFITYGSFNPLLLGLYAEVPGGGRITVTGTTLDFDATGSNLNLLDSYQLLVKEIQWVSSGVSHVNASPTITLAPVFANTEGSAVTFSSNAADADGDELTYAWDLDGDGTVDATTSSPSFTYPDNGTFTARVTVTDSHGASAAAEAPVTIANSAPAVRLVASAAEIVSGQSVDVTGSFADPGVHDAPWAYKLDWATGASLAGTLEAQADVADSHRYLQAGSYAIRYVVTDKDGGTGSAAVALTVRRLPIAMDVKPGSVENAINLNTSSTDADAKIPVAILSSADFDAHLVDVGSVRIGQTQNAVKKSGAYFASFDDVNGDGRADLVLHFERAALIANGDLTTSTTTLTLNADLTDGRQVVAKDVATPVP